MLTFNLKKEWFEKIKSGEKTHEYRLQNKYWLARILNFIGQGLVRARLKKAIETGESFVFNIPPCFPYSRACEFKCGYPKKDDKEKILQGLITKISANIDGCNTDLNVNEPVFDIEFELIRSKNV